MLRSPKVTTTPLPSCAGTALRRARNWRRKGIASALLARSLAALRDNGMTEATLDVDAENLSGALRIYERLGFEKRHHFVFYRKPLDR